MALHTHRLDANRHQAFLAEHRIDPVTRELLRAGDEIVICARCKSAFLADSWTLNYGKCACGHTETLADIPVNGTQNMSNDHQEPMEPKKETLDSITAFVSFLTRLISLVGIALITYGDYFQGTDSDLIKDIGSIFIGMILISIISSSLKKKEPSLKQIKISKNVPNITVLALGGGFCVLGLWGWNFVLKQYQEYFNQIVIVTLLVIPFSTLRGFVATRENRLYIAVPCLGAFLGFVLATTIYFTFVEIEFIQNLVRIAQTAIRNIQGLLQT